MPAVLPVFRIIVFSTVTLCSIVVLGLAAYLESLVNGQSSSSPYLTFIGLGIAAGVITGVLMPTLLLIGRVFPKSFTSKILFEIILMLVLWVLWIATAGITVGNRAELYPDGCDLRVPQAQSICNIITAIEAFSFLNWLMVFAYYDTLVLYSIIRTIQGRGCWLSSVREASNGPTGPAAAVPGVVPMTQQPLLQQYPQQPQGYPQQPYPQQVPYQQQPPAPGTPYGTPPQGPVAPHPMYAGGQPPVPAPQQSYTPPAPAGQGQPLYPQPTGSSGATGYGGYPEPSPSPGQDPNLHGYSFQAQQGSQPNSPAPPAGSPAPSQGGYPQQPQPQQPYYGQPGQGPVPHGQPPQGYYFAGHPSPGQAPYPQ
ncbi:hypothetical protein CONPUDRAFT_139802 [Coniophora puteana RWD-64-598 SS2]|uniref:MARVEL domain-containing protein n=1 Tax=Coniophora puteana (strain RWD-64-598) TaxID=741705 RepID=A0A5M3MBA3_CONPW|nr:uncharacterized protein CONPUDRAFT_139802 [Coniophora puteana RWD-64-598 SS2]EIW76519.1 hypothetical protein CONPUDRAFT_139802 [Coniophora puteana RWD-64-598 SS2]